MTAPKPETVVAMVADAWDDDYINVHAAAAVADRLVAEAVQAELVNRGVMDDPGQPKPTMHIIRRTDGETVDGEHTFFECDGPDDWTVPDEVGNDEPVEWEILACYPVATEIYKPGEEDDDEEAPDA